MNNHSCCELHKVNIQNLSVKSQGDILLHDINISFSCGELTALIGRNGAGKTTLVKAILGQLKYEGEISFLSHEDGLLRRPVIGYVPQHLHFDKSTPVSVEDFCLAGTEKKPLWLGGKREGLAALKERLEVLEAGHVLNRRLGDLSGGELQKVMLAAALSPSPDLLILDEPVSGVDASGLEIFYKTVTNLRDTYHTAILLVSHDLSLIRSYGDNAILLDKTIIAHGTTGEVFGTAEFKKAFGFLDLEVGGQ